MRFTYFLSLHPVFIDSRRGCTTIMTRNRCDSPNKVELTCGTGYFPPPGTTAHYITDTLHFSTILSPLLHCCFIVSQSPCVSLVLLNGSHKELANKLLHITSETTMTALAARNSSLAITAPTSAILGHALQNTRPEYRRKQDPRLSGSRHQPQTHTPLSSLMQRQILKMLKLVHNHQ